MSNDTGGWVEARRTCPHVQEHVAVAPDDDDDDDERKDGGAADRRCRSCAAAGGDLAEPWVCVRCWATHCGRYVHGHARAHAISAGHQIACGWADLSFWCYACDAYLDHRAIRAVYDLYSHLHVRKFHCPSPEPFAGP
ncbi:Zn-finger in ubiquitin-hydrolases protein [Plasmodiophora brassicae]